MITYFCYYDDFDVTMEFMESIAEKTIRKYLPSLKIKSRGLQLKSIPVIYRGLYDFEELDVQEQTFLLIKVKDKSLGPKDFKKHGKRLKDSIDYPQIWYLKELHPHKVRRMIENELNFIVEDKQVYLPTVSISIKAESEKMKFVNKLSGLSINLLIREILKGDLSGKNKVEIGEIFKSSKMTIGRAIDPLLSFDLCEEHKSGVAKLIQFKARAELWKYLQKNIQSPIKEAIFLKTIPEALPYSNITALSRQSMLAEDAIPSFAINKKEFNKKYKNIKIVLEDEAQSRIELWDRQTILQEDSCINAIDTYLVLKNSIDDRVQIELEMLLKKHNLEVGSL